MFAQQGCIDMTFLVDTDTNPFLAKKQTKQIQTDFWQIVVLFQGPFEDSC